MKTTYLTMAVIILGIAAGGSYSLAMAWKVRYHNLYEQTQTSTQVNYFCEELLYLIKN